MESLFLIVLCALLIVCITALIILLRNSSITNARKRDADDQIRRYEESTKMLLEETRRQYENQINTLEARLESQRLEMEQRLARREEEMSQRSSLEFSALATNILNRESANLREGNYSQIESILSPLRQRLAEFQQTVTDTYVKDNSSRTALARQIETLAKANSEIEREARRLSNALRGDTRVQGKWGETILSKLLERTGLVPGVHFHLQKASINGKPVKSDDGDGYRPDLVLMLPGDHKIVIDSKVSMTDYLKYVEADDERDAENYLKRHVLSVKKHVKELADKQYHRYIKGAMEHSLMFIPNDASFLAVLRGDADITDYAFRNNVVIVSPAHLLSIIQLISQLWRIEKQNLNAEKIADIGGKLYDKYVAFLTDFEKIERGLQSSLRAYEGCMRHISIGNQSLSARAERLREMGAKVTKKIPETMRETSEKQLVVSSSETGSQEEQTEADTEMPVSMRTGEIISENRE